MSYDFRLFVIPPGIDQLIAAQEAMENEGEDINPGPCVPEKEKRKRSIADALINADPKLEVFQFGFAEIAQMESISVEAAKERYRHLELNCLEEGPGIQITLFDDGATMTIPYWHKGKNAITAFQQLWTYLTIVQKTSGYAIYDPQLEKILMLIRIESFRQNVMQTSSNNCNSIGNCETLQRREAGIPLATVISPTLTKFRNPP